jgi:intracellular septation protein A
MTQIIGFLRFVLAEFGTLAVFYLLLYTVGLKAAIAGTIVFALVDGVHRLVYRRGFPKLYILTTILTFVFGGIDLMSETPFMIKYEAVITSLAVAGIFAYGARGNRPMLIELAEQRTGQRFPDRADIRAFFKLLTWVWAGYFLVRAIAYLWIGEALPIAQVMEIRPFIGTGSLLVMIALTFQARRLYAFVQRRGWLPTAA